MQTWANIFLSPSLTLAASSGAFLFLPSLEVSLPLLLSKVRVSVFPSLCLCLSLSFSFLSLYLSVSGGLRHLAPCLNLNFSCMYLRLSVGLSFCLCTFLHVCVCVFVSMALFLCVCLYVLPCLPLPLTLSLSGHICPTPWPGTQPETQIPGSAFPSYSRNYISAALGVRLVAALVRGFASLRPRPQRPWPAWPASLPRIRSLQEEYLEKR